MQFAELLEKVKNTVHLGLYDDETSRLCTWHLSRAHYLESWGDARTYDGTVSIVQPLIEPLFDGRSAIEVLAMILGDKDGHRRRRLRDRAPDVPVAAGRVVLPNGNGRRPWPTAWSKERHGSRQRPKSRTRTPAPNCR